MGPSGLPLGVGTTMADENRSPRSALNGLQRFSLLQALWQHAIIVARQRWGLQKAEYPGHDPGDLASMTFAVLPVGRRVLVLSNQDFDDSGHEDLPADERPSRIRIVAKVGRKWPAVRKAIELERYAGWEFTWLFDELPEADGAQTARAAIAQARVDEIHLRRHLFALRHQLRETESLLRAADRAERE
jgi:hypothetical protein